MNITTCILCGHAPLEAIGSEAARCPQCDLLHNLAAEDVPYVDGGGQAVPDAKKTYWRQVNAQRRLALIAPYLAGHDTLIDIGCGSGEMLLAAKDRSLQAIGFDTNRPLIRHIRERLGLMAFESPFDAALLPLAAAGHGRICTLAHVLEHLGEPLALVRQIHTAMRPGDLLYIEVPLHTGQSFRTQGFRWNLWASEHRALYAPQSLRFVATACGFETLACGTRIFARGSHSTKTRLRLFFRQPLRSLKTLLTKPRALSLADVLIGDYGFVVLRKA